MWRAWSWGNIYIDFDIISTNYGNKACRRKLVPGFTESRICCSSYQVHYMCKCCRAHVRVCDGQLFCREYTNSKLDDENDYYLVL